MLRLAADDLVAGSHGAGHNLADDPVVFGAIE
jgi:hypothetical protein